MTEPTKMVSDKEDPPLPGSPVDPPDDGAIDQPQTDDTDYSLYAQDISPTPSQLLQYYRRVWQRQQEQGYPPAPDDRFWAEDNESSKSGGSVKHNDTDLEDTDTDDSDHDDKTLFRVPADSGQAQNSGSEDTSSEDLFLRAISEVVVLARFVGCSTINEYLSILEVNQDAHGARISTEYTLLLQLNEFWKRTHSDNPRGAPPLECPLDQIETQLKLMIAQMRVAATEFGITDLGEYVTACFQYQDASHNVQETDRNFSGKRMAGAIQRQAAVKLETIPELDEDSDQHRDIKVTAIAGEEGSNIQPSDPKEKPGTSSEDRGQDIESPSASRRRMKRTKRRAEKRREERRRKTEEKERAEKGSSP